MIKLFGLQTKLLHLSELVDKVEVYPLTYRAFGFLKIVVLFVIGLAKVELNLIFGFLEEIVLVILIIVLGQSRMLSCHFIEGFFRLVQHLEED